MARYAAVVESVDRVRLVQRLSRGAEAIERDVSCLVQVSLDERAWPRAAPSRPTWLRWREAIADSPSSHPRSG